MGDDKEYYWNDECTLTITPKTGYRFEKLVFGTGDDAEEILATDCTFADGKYTYAFTVTGDIKVVAHFSQIADVDVTFAVTAKDWDGTAVTLENGTEIPLTSTTVSGQTYTYTVGGEAVTMKTGTYTVTCNGFCNTTVTVEQAGEIALNLAKPIATSTSNEITVTEDKTIAIKGNGQDDRNGNRKISADLKMSEEEINSTGLTLTFTVKRTKQSTNGNDAWAASRFGVQMGEGEIGFYVFMRSAQDNAADVAKLIPGTLSLNPDQESKSEKKWHGNDPDIKWVSDAAYGEGLQMKIVRANGVISIFAKNGEDWVALDTMGTKGETANVNDIGKLTIGNTVKNQIKFLAGGDDWQFSNIAVTLPAESEKATLTTSVNDSAKGKIETDIAGYYKGDKAILTITAKQGFELEKLVIGGADVNEGWTKQGLVYTYEYTLTEDTTIVANFIETSVPKVTPNITVSGKKYSYNEAETELAIVENTQITLKNEEKGYEFTGTIGSDGKVTFEEEIFVATYTVSAEGYFGTTVEIKEGEQEAIALTLYSELVDCEITVGETGADAKFVAEGATLKFKLGDVTKEVTVTADGKVKLENVPTGSYVTTANFGGYDLHLGWTGIAKTGKAGVTVDADGLCWSGENPKQQEFASVNIKEATIEIITNQAYHNRLKLANSFNSGAMVFKYELPANAANDAHGFVSMPIGNIWTVFNFDAASKTIKFGYTGTNDDWWSGKTLDLSSYWDNFASGGLTVIVDLNSSGAITTYAGESIEAATNQSYNRTCTATNVDKIEIGNAFGGNDLGNTNVFVTFKYGATVADLGVGSTTPTEPTTPDEGGNEEGGNEGSEQTPAE